MDGISRASGDEPVQPACRRCGLPLDQPRQAVSCHATSDGVVVYGRCDCGLLQVWLRTGALGPALLVTRQPAPAADRPVRHEVKEHLAPHGPG